MADRMTLKLLTLFSNLVALEKRELLLHNQLIITLLVSLSVAIC